MDLGPVPPYTNPPIQTQNFQPSRFVITYVELGVLTTVTTADPVNYVVGQLVKINIPYGYGCTQLNGFYGYVESIPSENQVVLSINSSYNVNQYVAYDGRTQPEIIAVGDVNSGIISTTGINIPTTNVPGAFINIS